MKPGVYNFPSQVRNDTFDGVRFTIKEMVGSVLTAVDLSGALIYMQFRTKPDSTTVVKNLSIGHGITVIDAAAGKIQIEPFLVDFANGGIYVYDLQVKFYDQTVRTYIQGTMNVIADVTRP